MNRFKEILVIFSLQALITTVSAEIRVVAHYELGRDVNQVTFTVGPQTLSPIAGEDHALQRQAEPRFFASAPPHLAGRGALKFDGDKDMYSKGEALFGARDNFAMEAWAMAEETGRQELQGVVANGHGGQGYVIGQMGDRWVVFVGSVGAVEIGKVQPGLWTHLAIVNDRGTADAYLNGERVNRFGLSAAVAPQFRIGNAGLPTEGFKGSIHSVRVATFADESFDPNHDFMLDYATLHQARAERTERHLNTFRAFANQPGIELTDTLDMPRMDKDWLIQKINQTSRAKMTINKEDLSGQIMLTNGLISRTFHIADNLACISYRNLSNEAEYVRFIKPEARVKLDDSWYDIGGLTGQRSPSFLLEEWLPELRSDPAAFQFVGLTTGTPVKRYPWRPKNNAVEATWPPAGLRVTMHYKLLSSSVEAHKDVTVDVHYELYDGIPVLLKSFTVNNKSDQPVIVAQIECEVLAVNEDQIKRIHQESDYSFHIVNMVPGNCHSAGDHSSAINHTSLPHEAGLTTTHWEVDPQHDMWAHPTAWEDKMVEHVFRNLLISRVPLGPAMSVEPGDTFESFNTFQLLQDSDDRERRSLGVRRMYRVIAPQITEFLMQCNTPSHDKALLKNLIDQMSELGFDHLVISFWPGLAHDNLDPAYLAHWREIADYAKERGVIIGGYELMVSSRDRGAAVNVIDPKTGQPGSPFGQSVCLGSEWFDTYMERMHKFIDATGVGSVNPDGCYHGDPCGSTAHKHHRGLEDSQWVQWRHQVQMIHELQARDVYIPAPDWYFLNGQTGAPMGGRESSANLPRELGLLQYRQYVYDGTWFKTAGMGIQHIGLIYTYDNNPNSTIEPLSENIEWYELNLMQVLASGSPPGVRANRLYDSPEVKAMVKGRMDWFNKYRDILTSDMIHVRRPDGRDIDAMLHVNPWLQEKGIVVLFNPLDRPMSRKVTLPLKYTGLQDKAMIREMEGELKPYDLDRSGNVVIEVDLGPRGYTWFVIEGASTEN